MTMFYTTPLNRTPMRKAAAALLALLIFLLAACAPATPVPVTGADPTPLPPGEVLVQLDYEPGFMLPEFRFPFGRTPYFTLLADGRVIYIDESQDFKVMQAQLSPDEAAALLRQVLDLGFERLESHTDFCGIAADGAESCVADAATYVLRVRLADGSLREIRNYAGFSNEPAAYEALYALLDTYTQPEATVYLPHAATLFVRSAPAPEMASPAEWPLDAAYARRALAAPDQLSVVVLSADEAALWQRNVGVDNSPIVFQLEGQPVSATFVPWLPGADFTAEIAAEFPAE